MVTHRTLIHIKILILCLILFHGLNETKFYTYQDTCLCSKNAPDTAYINRTRITVIETTPNEIDPDIVLI